MSAVEKKDLSKKKGSRLFERFMLNYSLYAVLLVILVVFGVLNKNFFTVNNILNNFDKYSYLLVLGCGSTLILTCGGFDLSSGGVLAAMTVLGAEIMNRTHNIWAGVLSMILVGGLVGFIDGFLIIKLRLVAFLCSVAVGYVVRGIALGFTQAKTISGLPSKFTGFAWGKVLGIPNLIWVGLGAFLVLLYLLHFTGYGRRVFSVGGNASASHIMGIEDQWVAISTYALAGALSGLAAVMTMAKSSVARATTGANFQMYGIAVSVIGGTSLKGGHGSIPGTLLGVCIYSLIISGLNATGVDAFWQEVFTGAIIVLATVIDSYKTRYNS